MTASEPRLPDFYIVGQAKCGTSALVEMLQAHPSILVPEKEPTYFASDLRWTSTPRRIVSPRPTTLAEYTSLYRGVPAGAVVGDASTQYLFSETAAANIASARPDARIIAFFREPASFLQSLHLEFVKQEIEDVPDLRAALSLEGERRQGRALPADNYLPALLEYSRHVRYAEQLARFRAHFPESQMQVFLYDDFRADPVGVARRVTDFLGLERSDLIRPVLKNEAAAVRSRRAQRLIHRLSVAEEQPWRAGRTMVKSILSHSTRERLVHAFYRRAVFRRPPTDELLLDELAALYRPEVEALGDALGRDLVTIWYGDRD